MSHPSETMIRTDRRAVVLTAELGTVDGHQLEWSSAHVFSIADGVVVGFTSYQDDAYHAFCPRSTSHDDPALVRWPPQALDPGRWAPRRTRRPLGGGRR